MIQLPKQIGSVRAFATIIDINHFSFMVKNDCEGIIAQFTRDVLSGSISAAEKEGGEVVGFMGDAILALLPNAESFFLFATRTARDLDRQCEYISDAQRDNEDIWGFTPGGPSLKILAEYGTLDVSTIYSRLLGEQRLFIGDAINYAARIGQAGEGNRCLLGPHAAKLVAEAGYELIGPNHIHGKQHEAKYEYYQLELGDIWREGKIQAGDDTYWG